MSPGTILRTEAITVIKKSAFIIYWVSDMKRAQRFYRDLLGLKPQIETDGWSQYEMGAGPGLALHPGVKESASKSPVLGFEVDDLKTARKRLEAAGASGITEPHAIPGGLTLDFQDPDGHVLELVQYTGSQRWNR